MPTNPGEKIERVGDAVAVIRKTPRTYAGDKPWGPKFADSLMQDLIYLDALPARVERLEGWWIVSSDRDWLTSADGSVNLEAFSRPFPKPAPVVNSIRTEVLIAALANAVVTCGRDGLKWINGDPDRWPPSPELVKKLSSIGTGRIVAFIIGDEP